MIIEPSISIYLIILLILFLVIAFQAIRVVPQQQVWIIERLGKFNNKSQPGLNILIPFIDRVAYKHSLKEQAIDVMEQTAITNDNVTLRLDGILYVRIVDAEAASYGVNDPYYAVVQLAQTTMRSEIGKMTLDKTFEERHAIEPRIDERTSEKNNLSLEVLTKLEKLFAEHIYKYLLFLKVEFSSFR